MIGPLLRRSSIKIFFKPVNKLSEIHTHTQTHRQRDRQDLSHCDITSAKLLETRLYNTQLLHKNHTVLTAAELLVTKHVDHGSVVHNMYTFYF